MERGRLTWIGAALATSALTAPAAAGAAEAEATQLTELVVTAQRRETNLMRTPAAVSALSAQAIEQGKIRGVEDVANMTPGLVFAQSNSELQASIRGVGVDNPFMTAEAGVGVYIDGVYLGRPNIATAALFDLERIEVVRGPQGTLYGRNATGGAINVVTREPSATPGADVSVSYGNYDALELSANASGPLSATVAGRISAAFTRHDGYDRNLFNGRRLFTGDDLSLRGALSFTPNDRLRVVARADYQRVHDAGPNNKPFSVGSTAADDVVQFTFGPGTGRFVNDPHAAFHDLQDSWRRRYWGGSLTATYDLGGAVLKSISAYRDSFTSQDADLDGTDGFINTLHNRKVDGGALNAHQVSQELQLASKSGGRLNYIAGLYYYGERSKVAIRTDAFDFVCCVVRTDNRVTQDIDSVAAFGELYYQVTDALKLTVGLRTTRERKRYTSDVGFLAADGKTFTSTTPKVGLDYTVNENVFLYALYAEGFKAGGFNGFTNRGPYTPEKLKDFEAGAKLRAFDNRLQASLSAFSYRYSDLQVTQFTAQGPDISNVGRARIKGAELDVRVLPVEGLELGGAAAYLDAEYDDFSLRDLITGVVSDVGGNRVVKSPKWTLTGSAQYVRDVGGLGELTLHYDIGYKTSYFFSAFNSPAARQKSYAVSNARISFAPAGGRWEVAAYVKNLTNVAYFTQATQASALLLPTVTYNPPRTYGVTLSAHF